MSFTGSYTEVEPDFSFDRRTGENQCMCPIAQRGPDVTSIYARNSMMETKVPDFVSTMSMPVNKG